MKILIKYLKPQENQRLLRRPENHHWPPTWASMISGEETVCCLRKLWEKEKLS